MCICRINSLISRRTYESHYIIAHQLRICRVRAMEKSLSAASEAVRGKCRGLPRIPWVAKWFTAGQAALKLLQLASRPQLRSDAGPSSCILALPSKLHGTVPARPTSLSHMQLSCSIAVIVLFSWSKDPSSVISFDNLVLEDARGPLDFRPHWYFFASVGLFTSAYALLLPAAGFVGLDVWPSAVSVCVCVCVCVCSVVRSREAVTTTLPPPYPQRTCLSVLCTLLWLVGGPVMSVAITIMEASRYANQNMVDFLMPKVATVRTMHMD